MFRLTRSTANFKERMDDLLRDTEVTEEKDMKIEKYLKFIKANHATMPKFKKTIILIIDSL